MRIQTFTAGVLALGFAAWPLVGAAAPSTPTGQVSVGQVREMVEKAGSEPTARQVLTAYLAGIGETIGALVSPASCSGPLTQSAESVMKALQGASASAAATPLLVRDLLQRGGCKVASPH